MVYEIKATINETTIVVPVSSLSTLDEFEKEKEQRSPKSEIKFTISVIE